MCDDVCIHQETRFWTYVKNRIRWYKTYTYYVIYGRKKNTINNGEFPKFRLSKLPISCWRLGTLFLPGLQSAYFDTRYLGIEKN